MQRAGAHGARRQARQLLLQLPQPLLRRALAHLLRRRPPPFSRLRQCEIRILRRRAAQAPHRGPPRRRQRAGARSAHALNAGTPRRAAIAKQVSLTGAAASRGSDLRSAQAVQLGAQGLGGALGGLPRRALLGQRRARPAPPDSFRIRTGRAGIAAVCGPPVFASHPAPPFLNQQRGQDRQGIDPGGSVPQRRAQHGARRRPRRALHRRRAGGAHQSAAACASAISACTVATMRCSLAAASAASARPALAASSSRRACGRTAPVTASLGCSGGQRAAAGMRAGLW